MTKEIVGRTGGQKYDMSKHLEEFERLRMIVGLVQWRRTARVEAVGSSCIRLVVKDSLCRSCDK